MAWEHGLRMEIVWEWPGDSLGMAWRWSGNGVGIWPRNGVKMIWECSGMAQNED